MVSLCCEFTAQPVFDTIDRIFDHYRRGLRIDQCRGDLVYVPASWKLLTKEYPVKGRVSWRTFDALHERLCAVRYRTVW